MIDYFHDETSNCDVLNHDYRFFVQYPPIVPNGYLKDNKLIVKLSQQPESIEKKLVVVMDVFNCLDHKNIPHHESACVRKVLSTSNKKVDFNPRIKGYSDTVFICIKVYDGSTLLFHVDSDPILTSNGSGKRKRSSTKTDTRNGKCRKLVQLEETCTSPLIDICPISYELDHQFLDSILNSTSPPQMQTTDPYFDTLLENDNFWAFL